MMLAFTGCSTLTTHADWDTSANFSQLRSYAWVPGQQPPTGNPRIDNNMLLDDRVREAIDSALKAKGYSKNDANPDFWVSYQAAIQGKIEATTFPSYGYMTPYGGPYGAGAYNYAGWSSADTMITSYDEGSIIIDLADAKIKRLLWRGTVSDVMDPSRTPVERAKRIDQAVTKAFKAFPPK
jgi:hypothetical protein